jgi:L-asparaginase
MGLKDWNLIAKAIQSNWNSYDSFVIIHGYDTIFYTGSAISFMFENNNKSIILTNVYSNDIVKAITICKTINFNDVCILQNVNNENTEPVLIKAVNIKNPIYTTVSNNSLSLRPPFGGRSELRDLFTLMNPDIKIKIIKVQPDLKSVPLSGENCLILDNYKSGSISSTLIAQLKEIKSKGVLIVSTSSSGSISPELEKIGVINGGSIQIETLYIKCLYILSNIQGEQRKNVDMNKLFSISLRGE